MAGVGRSQEKKQDDSVGNSETEVGDDLEHFGKLMD